MPAARRAGLGLAAAAALLGCVETGDLFDETGADAPRVVEEAPSSAGPEPSTGSPDVVSGGTGAATPPRTSEAGPPLVRVEPPLAPASPGRGDDADPDPDPGSEPEPDAAPSPSDPAGPDAPVAPEPPAPGGDDTTGGARACRELASPLLLDFEQVESVEQAFFGDFQSVFSGGTFVYPDLTAVAPDEAGELPPGLVSDVTEGDWHVRGLVGEPAGLGVFFDCQSLDASRFSAIAFRIQGEIEGARELVFFIGSASNDVSRAWLVEQGAAAPTPSFGRCRPAAAQFDGSCDPARVTLSVSSEPTEVVVPFAAFAGGSPEPGLNPAEITTVQWALPAPVGGAPYAVDLRIDDIRFVDSE